MSHISSCFSFPHFKYCVPHIIVKFLRICRNEDIGNVVLVLAGEHCEHLLTNRRYFCLYCTFKNCLRQFAQLCSLYVVPGRTSHGKNTYIRFCLHFYRVKRKQHIVFSLLNSCALWFPEFMKDYFEAAAIKVIKSFQAPLLLAVNFILDCACGDNCKTLVLWWNTKKVNKSDWHAECVLLWHSYLSVQHKKISFWTWRYCTELEISVYRYLPL